MINSKEFKDLKEYRQNVSDSDLKSVSIVCYEDDISEALTFFRNQYDIEIERFLVPLTDSRGSKIDSFDGIPIENLKDNIHRENLAVYIDELKASAISVVVSYEKDNFYIYMNNSNNSGFSYYKKPQPSFFLSHKTELMNAYNLLSSKKSKKVFLQRLKSIITGKYGYLAYEQGFQYFPKDLMPVVEKGATVIDAGIGSSLQELRLYSDLVKTKGRIYAFEASPVEYENVKRDAGVRQCRENIELINLGLWNENTTMKMSATQSSSSVVYVKAGETVDCELVALDNFVKERALEKVDYIKMDIEGAELNALKGAKETIQKHQPDMAICVYHDSFHLWELILYINSVYNGYDFYLYHHGLGCCETVLYAVKKSFKIKTSKFFRRIFARLSKMFCVEKIYNSILARYQKVLIYGAGTHFEQLYSQGVFKNMNILGISDIKFENNGEDLFKEYKTIPPSKIEESNPDLIYVAMADKSFAKDVIHRILGKNIDSVKIINI